MKQGEEKREGRDEKGKEEDVTRQEGMTSRGLPLTGFFPRIQKFSLSPLHFWISSLQSSIKTTVGVQHATS
jgi:hypothetical protein